MRHTALIFLFIFSFAQASQFQTSDQLVAHFAMQTIKSRKFKDLARNLFPFQHDRKEFADYIKKHDLQNRSLPDVVVEGDTMTIKERSRSTTLDLSKLKEMKLIYNKTVVPLTGNETYVDLYLTFLKLHDQNIHSRFMSFFFKEAYASPVVIAVVALTAYAKAALTERIDQMGCPENQKACETLAQQIQSSQKAVAFHTCDAKSGVISYTLSEMFMGQVRKIRYSLEVSPVERPTEISLIKVKAGDYRCEFQKVEMGLEDRFDPTCHRGQETLDDDELEPDDYQTIVKNSAQYKDILKCCAEEACAHYLLTPITVNRQMASQAGPARLKKNNSSTQKTRNQ